MVVSLEMMISKSIRIQGNISSVWFMISPAFALGPTRVSPLGVALGVLKNWRKKKKQKNKQSKKKNNSKQIHKTTLHPYPILPHVPSRQGWSCALTAAMFINHDSPQCVWVYLKNSNFFLLAFVQEYTFLEPSTISDHTSSFFYTSPITSWLPLVHICRGTFLRDTKSVYWCTWKRFSFLFSS